VRCWVFPRPDPRNPYQALLAASLERQGIESRPGRRLTPLWALRAADGDAVHLHWIEFMVASDRHPTWLRDLEMTLRAANLWAALAVLRTRGIQIVWTVHNIAPHESRQARIERLTMKAVARLATTLHVHSRWAADRVERELGPGNRAKLMVAHHGNYLDTYGAAVPRDEARRRLGIPAAGHAYLIFGVVRRYKEIPGAIEAFRRLEAADAMLVVAGRVQDRELGAQIEREAAKDPRVRLRLGFVPEEEVADLFAAADAAILNYSEIFSSGALMAALSTGTPVVAPEAGIVDEFAGSAAVEPFGPGELTEAMAGVVAGDPGRRREAALEAARRCDWDSVADELAGALRGPAAG
jgi:beta-1,4-mannosyltransferase